MALARAIFEEYWPRWQQHFAQDARLRLGCVGLADLASCTSEMASEYLRAEELDRWTSFSMEKRRTEWLGGRLAAKWAAAGLLGETAVAWQGMTIRTESDGRPYVVPAAQATAPFISISHSGPMAATLAANLPCGLDIQEPGDRILRVRERFVNSNEEPILNASFPGRSCAETERLTMLWAAKEAVRKMVRITPLLGLLEIRLLAGHGGGTPQDPLALHFASGRDQEDFPAFISVLCFFADNLAWAMACSPTQKE